MNNVFFMKKKTDWKYNTYYPPGRFQNRQKGLGIPPERIILKLGMGYFKSNVLFLWYAD